MTKIETGVTIQSRCVDNYLRVLLIGEKCFMCLGSGLKPDPKLNPGFKELLWDTCRVCNGTGKICGNS